VSHPCDNDEEHVQRMLAVLDEALSATEDPVQTERRYIAEALRTLADEVQDSRGYLHGFTIDWALGKPLNAKKVIQTPPFAQVSLTVRLDDEKKGTP
jgi:hypothetical protein